MKHPLPADDTQPVVGHDPDAASIDCPRTARRADVGGAVSDADVAAGSLWTLPGGAHDLYVVVRTSGTYAWLRPATPCGREDHPFFRDPICRLCLISGVAKPTEGVHGKPATSSRRILKTGLLGRYRRARDPLPQPSGASAHRPPSPSRARTGPLADQPSGQLALFMSILTRPDSTLSTGPRSTSRSSCLSRSASPPPDRREPANTHRG